MNRALALVLIVFSSQALGAGKPTRKQADCEAEVLALRAELAETKLELEKLKTKAAQSETASTQKASSEVQAARAAVLAVRSVLENGAYPDFKQYFLAAKIKVDALPPSDDRDALGPVVQTYSDIHTLWNQKILSSAKHGAYIFGRDLLVLETRYPGIARAIPPNRPVRQDPETNMYSIDTVISYLRATAEKQHAVLEWRSQ